MSVASTAVSLPCHSFRTSPVAPSLHHSRSHSSFCPCPLSPPPPAPGPCSLHPLGHHFCRHILHALHALSLPHVGRVDAHARCCAPPVRWRAYCGSEEQPAPLAPLAGVASSSSHPLMASPCERRPRATTGGGREAATPGPPPHAPSASAQLGASPAAPKPRALIAESRALTLACCPAICHAGQGTEAAPRTHARDASGT